LVDTEVGYNTRQFLAVTVIWIFIGEINIYASFFDFQKKALTVKYIILYIFIGYFCLRLLNEHQ